MRKFNVLILLLAMSILMGCKSIPNEKEYPSAKLDTQTVQESETIYEAPTYNPEYFTEPKDGQIEKVDSYENESEKSADSEYSIDNEKSKDIVKEFASCLYPEMNISDVSVSHVTFNKCSYELYEIISKEGFVCRIARKKESNDYYLYDKEVQMLIPIEYDEYGIRLIG